MAFRFECGESGAHGRISRWIWNSLHDFADRRTAVLVESIYDLTFPSAQMYMVGFHNAGNLAVRACDVN
jgi:hypothetical protein